MAPLLAVSREPIQLLRQAKTSNANKTALANVAGVVFYVILPTGLTHP